MYPKWLRGQDLNLRSPAYETGELPGFSTPRQKFDLIYSGSHYLCQNKHQSKLAPTAGLEPATQ